MPTDAHPYPDPQPPRVDAPDSGWWLTASATVLAFGVFLAPTFAQLGVWWRLAVAVGSFALLLAALWAVKVGRWVRHHVRRSRAYPALFAERQELRRGNDDLRRAIVNLVSPATMFNPQRMYLLGDKVHVEFDRPPGRPLERPCEVMLVQIADGIVFGRFELLEVRPRVYQAVEVGSVDSVLRGHLIATTSELPPAGSFVVPVPAREIESTP